MKKLVHIINKEDIGKHFIKLKNCFHCGKNQRVIDVHNFMGKILNIDVGNRIYDVDGIYYVESQQQAKKRIKNVTNYREKESRK